MFGAENPSKIDVLRNAYKKYATTLTEEPKVSWRDTGEAFVEKTLEAQKQYDEVATKYRGTPQWMKAPNGKPTNLTERQWVQVRTPNFKKWFGDWENDPANASKVVDENGEPMVVYHGSTAMFNEFKSKFIGHSTGTADGRGFYFTTDKSYAEVFKSKDGRVIEAFLNIRDTLDYKKKTISKAALKKIIKEIDRAEFETDGEHYFISNFGNYYDEGIDKVIDEATKLNYDFCDTDVEIFNVLISSGADFDLTAKAIKNVTGKDGEIVPKDNNTTHFIIFNSNQAKSASDNVGAFDGGNPDIRWRIDDADISDISAKVEKIIDSVSDKKNRHIEVLRKVSDAEADFLLEKTGLDLKGYSHSIDNYSILHILKKHGSKKELQRGQIPVTIEDIRNFPTIVSDYDDVEYVGKSNIGRDTIRFEKSIGGNNVLVFEEMRVGKKLLALSTMYIQKRKKLTSNANASSNTSETLSTSSDFQESENAPENQEKNSRLRFLLRQERTENPVIWASIVLAKEIYLGRKITASKLETVLPSAKFDGKQSLVRHGSLHRLLIARIHITSVSKFVQKKADSKCVRIRLKFFEKAV